MNDNFLTAQLLKCVFSKNEFKSFDEILDYLLERRFNDFSKKVSNSFNFFPSDEKGRCAELAYFVSISDKKVSLKANQKIKLDVMMQNFIRHCQGSCMKTVKHVIIITDKYDNEVINFWKSNIENIKNNGVKIELNIVVGQTILKKMTL